MAGRILRGTLCVLIPPLLLSHAGAALLNVGDIAFVGFNADGNDDFAFLSLVDLDGGELIHFNVNEWTGSRFDGISEDSLTWQATDPLAAGTVVVFTETRRSSTIGVNHGTILDDSSQVNTLELRASGDTILAHAGDRSDPSSYVFLAAISNKPADYTGVGSNGTLDGTGLVAGTTALLLNPTGADIDGGVYAGSRDGQAQFADYLPLIADIAGNWITDADGRNVLSGGELDATTFASESPSQPAASVPELPTRLLLPIALALLLLTRWPCRRPAFVLRRAD